MPIYRVVIAMNQSVGGWSEAYYTRGNVSPGAFPARLSTLINARRNMMFTNQEFVSFRVGDVGTDPNNISFRRKSTPFPPGKFPFPGTGVVVDFPERGIVAIIPETNRPDQLRVALNVRVSYGDGLSTTRYLAAPPDQISRYEPATLNFDASPTYLASYNAWRTEVSTNWALVARGVGASYPIINVNGVFRREASPALFGVSVNAAGTPAPNWTVGDTVHLRNFLSRPRVPSVNGAKWQVDSINTTLMPGSIIYWLRVSELVDPSRIKKMGSIQKVGYALQNITGIEAYRIGVHKRGRPFSAPRGRRLARPTLDP